MADVNRDGVIDTKDAEAIKAFILSNSTEIDYDSTLFITLDDAKLESSERAINNYAVNDAVCIRCSVFEGETYAIKAMYSMADNTILAVAPYNVLDKQYTGEFKVLTLDGGGDLEDWIWVRGKSCGEPILGTQGSFLAGEENTSTGRYTFGGGRQNQLNGDGATAFGRQNVAGYLAFAMGRSNTVHGGYVFGNSNQTGYKNSAFVTGQSNKIYKTDRRGFISGWTNKVYGGTTPIVVGESNEAYDEGHKDSGIFGYQNYLHDAQRSFGFGYRQHMYGNANFSTGSNNTIKGSNNFLSGQNSSIEATAINCGFIGNGLTGSGTEQLVVGHFNADDVNAALIVGNGVHTNSRKNAFVIKKTGEATLQGEMTANGVNLNKKITELEDTILELKKQIETLSGKEE